MFGEKIEAKNLKVSGKNLQFAHVLKGRDHIDKVFGRIQQMEKTKHPKSDDWKVEILSNDSKTGLATEVILSLKTDEENVIVDNITRRFKKLVG